MHKDVKCPYCGAGQDICHDDGQGFEENVTHSQMCKKCNKVFAYETTIVFYYDTFKADCLNGSPHTFQRTHAYPKECSTMRCTDCGCERGMTDEERKAFGIGTIEDYHNNKQ
ncbi:MAG: hypothetical protein LBQ39_07810 [Tannerellaceae bacterium]|jgi:hypothetical protein|nr:hypothetical protein [Tannerellaceae bacterium]